MDNSEQKAYKDIKEHGCHILHILGDDENPPFSYSIGIQQTSNHPEIIITGMDIDDAHKIINEYNRLVKSGNTIIPDKLYDCFLENYSCSFKLVKEKYYKEYFGWARWLYNGNNFNALQLIYPNIDGIWPWDEKASSEFKWFIPTLYE
ncbi:DUF4262 domain-containing protein [Leptospira noumeaensis]|uniref:DUF4262 domain-containing protein n=1 Tax=Leptospira noumeaensis TaxID=2484964 RepID=A0A4R9I9F8_9LEPT|nr:DUF4262 domain-containing protein [Leptospira noumeaensis]TGK82974.1 DUF4262 domain-containing protein [Leptospira noumeaensis]